MDIRRPGMSDDCECVFDELDAEIEEIAEKIRELKRNKSQGPDRLLNEFFIEFMDFILPYLFTLFNFV